MERSHLVRLSAAAAGLLVTSAVTASPAHATTALNMGTQASAGGPVGTPITDTATLSGYPTATPPTGYVSFSIYGPNDPTCANAVIYANTANLNAGGQATSPAFTPTAAGTYQIVATYSGDTNYTAPASTCAKESVTITPGPQPTGVPGGGACTPGAASIGDGNNSDTYGNLGQGNQGNCNVGDGNEGNLTAGDGSAGNPPEDE